MVLIARITIWIVCVLIALPAADTRAEQERNEERSENIDLEIREALHNRHEAVRQIKRERVQVPGVHNTIFIQSIITNAASGCDLNIILRNLRI